MESPDVGKVPPTPISASTATEKTGVKPQITDIVLQFKNKDPFDYKKGSTPLHYAKEFLSRLEAQTGVVAPPRGSRYVTRAKTMSEAKWGREQGCMDDPVESPHVRLKYVKDPTGIFPQRRPCAGALLQSKEAFHEQHAT